MKLSLAAKLNLTLVPIVLTGAASIWFLHTGLNTNAQELIEARQLKERALQSLTLLLTQDDASKALLIDMENFDAGERKIQAYDAMQAIFRDLKSTVAAPEVLVLIKEMEELDRDQLRPLDTQLLETMAGGNATEARKLYFGSYQPIRARYEAGVRKLVEYAEQRAVTAAENMRAKNRRSFATICASLVGGLAVAMIILLVVTRRTTERLKRAAVSLENEAQITTESTAGLEAASRTVAEGANRQAAALEETGAALQEISSMTNNNATNAQTAKDRANQTRAAADASARDVKELVRAMDELRACSDGVARIIKTIDEIAFQTNILALNAAVEAARAGEAGLGFAVVADEVRSLAQRSKHAARETAEQIENSLSKGERGVQLSKLVATSLESMIGHAHEVDRLVAEIAVASREQSQGLGQLNAAVVSLDRITQGNAASAEQSAAAAGQLSAQASELERTVCNLRELVYGSGSRSGVGIGEREAAGIEPNHRLLARTSTPVALPAEASAK